MVPLLPFAAGLVVGAAALRLLRSDAARAGLAKVRQRMAGSGTPEAEAPKALEAPKPRKATTARAAPAAKRAAAPKRAAAKTSRRKAS